jgi:hypothetical protein
MKKKLFLALIIIITVSLFISGQVLAAWTQAKGHAYNQLTFSYYKSKAKFDTVPPSTAVDPNQNHSGVPQKIKQPKFIDYKLTYYGEYGITNDLTVFTSIPYVWIESEDVMKVEDKDGPSGVGDINFGLRHKLSNNLLGSGMLMSAQGQVKIPEAYQLNYDLENPINFQNVGDGQYDLTLALMFGKGFNKGYMVINAGYKFRYEETEFDFKPSDQITLRIDGGYSIHPKLSLRGNFEWTKSIGNASVSNDTLNDYQKAFGLRDKETVIKDALGLEPDSVKAGVALAYSFTSKTQTVLSYDTVLRGWGTDYFRTRDSGVGRTFAIAMVYMF